MAISLVAASSAVVFGATSASPAYPAGLQSGDTLYLGAGCKDDSATFPTISGWTKVFEGALGGGVDGAGTGLTQVCVYKKDTVTGSESGTVTVTPSGSVNIVGAAMIAWRCGAGNVIELALASGSDTAAGSAIDITESPAVAETANDLMLGWVVAAANSNMGSQTFTATDATFGTAVEHLDAGSTTGNDIRCSWISRPVTSGTASAATHTTNTATGTAGCVFMRLREVAAAAPGPVFRPRYAHRFLTQR